MCIYASGRTTGVVRGDGTYCVPIYEVRNAARDPPLDLAGRDHHT